VAAAATDGSAELVGLWRADRRNRALRSLDWTRYHLWVYFVDGLEPSYARARLCRYFFERVCAARGSSSLLYCAAGGVDPSARGELDLLVASAVPDLHADDLQNLMIPPYTFSPRDVDMYDLVVATDERSLQGVRRSLAEDGRGADPEHLCLISDFLDAYDVLLAAEEAEGWAPAGAPPAPGLLTLGSLQSLAPGMPLRGAPRRQPVGPPLADLPQAWAEVLWPAAGDSSELDDDDDAPGEVRQDGAAVAEGMTDRERAQRNAGRILRSVVGLERVLKRSVPEGMRWWNDEE